MKKLFRKIWLIIIISAFSLVLLPHNTSADDMKVDDFNILPELTDEEKTEVNSAIDEIWKSAWNVWNVYNQKAADPNFTTEEQIASWIMNWDTIMNYLVFVVKFLSQLGMVVWLIFIMYAGYKYMFNVFHQKSWKQPLVNVIIGVVIIIFSYAIMRLLTSLVWLT